MSGYRESVVEVTATIASSGTTSGAVDLGVACPVGLTMPAALTGTAITFLVSNDNSNYVALYDYDTAAAVSITFVASKAFNLPTRIFAGWRYLKIVSNGTEGSSRAFLISSRVVA